MLKLFPAGLDQQAEIFTPDRFSRIPSTRWKVHLNNKTPSSTYTGRDVINHPKGFQAGRGELWSVLCSMFIEFPPEIGYNPAHRDSFFHSSSNLARRGTSSRFVTT